MRIWIDDRDNLCGDLSRKLKTQIHMIDIEVLMSIKQRGYLIIITELPNRQDNIMPEEQICR